MIDLMTLRPFRMRLAYIRLSRHDTVPGNQFGDEVNVLSERGHIDCTDEGWQLTQAGADWWAIAVRDRLPSPTSHRGIEWLSPGQETTLWALSQGSRYQWHPSKAYRAAVRVVLHELHFLENQGEMPHRVCRLTNAGWNYVQEWITGEAPRGSKQCRDI
jgi:hypothetical protein